MPNIHPIYNITYLCVIPMDTMPASTSKYRNVALPEPLIDRIKQLIEEHPERGFISVSDFVRHATIEKLESYTDK